jgi:hypothetical protein
MRESEYAARGELGGEALLVPDARRDAVEEAIERARQAGELVVGSPRPNRRSSSYSLQLAASSVMRETGRRARPSIHHECGNGGEHDHGEPRTR